MVAYADTTICLGDTVILQAAGGVSYLWSTDNGGISDITNSKVRVWPAAAATYSVVITNASCCTRFLWSRQIH